MQNKRVLKKIYLAKIKEKGFSFIEIIFVVMLILIITTISLPLFNFSKNKAKQKEATLIINSLIKAAKANYAINTSLPEDIREISKFLNIGRCNNIYRDLSKNSICYLTNSDINFYSYSGNFKIEQKKLNESKFHKIFQVRAIPVAKNAETQISSVVGCFNPLTGMTLIKEYSIFNPGVQPFNSCLTEEEEEARLAEEAKLAEEARLAEEAELAEEARLAEEAKLAEEARLAEEAKLAEESKPKCLRWNPRNPSQCFIYQ